MRRGHLTIFACTDPETLSGLNWLICYLTTGKHLLFYAAFGTVLLLLAITAPAAMAFGFGGAMAARSRIAPLRWFGKGYIAVVRGVPDIAFFPVLRDRAGSGYRIYPPQDQMS